MADERVVFPDDEKLLYDQYYDLAKSHERASFHRCYDPRYGCDLPRSLGFGREWWYHPGARVTLVTNATRVHAKLAYVIACEASCPGTLPNNCYRPAPSCSGSAHVQCGTCTNQCSPQLYVDGELRALPSRHSEYGEGVHDVLLLEVADSSPRRERRLELVMPWGGQVELLHFRLCCATPNLQQPMPSSEFHFVAYGDSITQGFCAGTPYPEALARLNGWHALNLGIGGMKTSPQHGISLGRVRADLVLMAIGTNDWWGSCDVTDGIGGTIQGLRNEKPTLPLVVVTMLVRGDEPGHNARKCIVLEDFRQQIRNEVERRRHAGDNHLHLIEGKPLLSLSRLGDGLHPGSSAAMEELAANLNAQMGFSAVQYTLTCETSTLRVRVHGLIPHGTCELHWGTVLENVVLDAPCAARSLMVGGASGKQATVVDAVGKAAFEVQLASACDATLVQVIDLTTCTASRVTRPSYSSSVMGSVAEEFATRLSPLWPPPSSPTPVPKLPPQPHLPTPTPPKPASPLPVSPAQSPTPPPTPSSPKPGWPPTAPLRSPSPQAPSPLAPFNVLWSFQSTTRSILGGDTGTSDAMLMAIGLAVPALLLLIAKRVCAVVRRTGRKFRPAARTKYASLGTSSKTTSRKRGSNKQAHRSAPKL